MSGLREYSAYYFRVRAVVGTIMGEPSEEARATSKSAPKSAPWAGS